MLAHAPNAQQDHLTPLSGDNCLVNCEVNTQLLPLCLPLVIGGFYRRDNKNEVQMRAIILAAGLGWRLGAGILQGPKCLLNFDNQSLLERHLVTLKSIGISEVHIGVGYRASDIHAELRHIDTKLGLKLDIELVHNPDYHEGNIVTLEAMSEALRAGGEVLLMDADVLYHGDIMSQLQASVHANCFLLDRNFEPGDEPVKICVREGQLVEFSKQIQSSLKFDLCGESVGFFKLSQAIAERLADKASAYLANGHRGAFYEAALRELLIESPGEFGYEEITGIPWIEIDFQEDILRAEREVLIHIKTREAA